MALPSQGRAWFVWTNKSEQKLTLAFMASLPVARYLDWLLHWR